MAKTGTPKDLLDTLDLIRGTRGPTFNRLPADYQEV